MPASALEKAPAADRGCASRGAALQRIRRVGIARRERGEVGAAARGFEGLLRPRPRRFNALGTGLFRHPYEDVRKLVLHARVRLGLHLGKEEIDLGVAHLDAFLHLALAHAGEQDLLAQLLAPRLERDAIALERTPEISQAHIVVLRHTLHRAVELQLIDANALVARELKLGLVQNQPLQHLALEEGAPGSGVF